MNELFGLKKIDPYFGFNHDIIWNILIINMIWWVRCFSRNWYKNNTEWVCQVAWHHLVDWWIKILQVQEKVDHSQQNRSVTDLSVFNYKRNWQFVNHFNLKCILQLIKRRLPCCFVGDRHFQTFVPAKWDFVAHTEKEFIDYVR